MSNKYLKTISWLNDLASEAQFFRKKVKPTLEVTQQLLEALDNPDLNFKYRVIVGGTAGKGTVCYLVEDVLIRENQSCGCLISPHLQIVRERIRINGKIISEEDFGDAVCQVKTVAQALKIVPTYYEAIVVAGILAASDAGVEVLVAEIGMGGEFDAVNAIRGDRISVLTFVGSDHLEFFNNSLPLN